MNIGTEQIKHKILRALKKSNAQLKGIRYGEFADNLAQEIYDLIGDEMSKKEWDLAHDFPAELKPVVDQLRQGFSFEPKRDQMAIETYTWMKEQGRDKIAAFIKWATDKERVQFVMKYRNSPGQIKNDWKLAFDQTAPAITRNADGSLNV